MTNFIEINFNITNSQEHDLAPSTTIKIRKRKNDDYDYTDNFIESFEGEEDICDLTCSLKNFFVHEGPVKTPLVKTKPKSIKQEVEVNEVEVLERAITGKKRRRASTQRHIVPDNTEYKFKEPILNYFYGKLSFLLSQFKDLSVHEKIECFIIYFMFNEESIVFENGLEKEDMNKEEGKLNTIELSNSTIIDTTISTSTTLEKSFDPILLKILLDHFTLKDLEEFCDNLLERVEKSFMDVSIHCTNINNYTEDKKQFNGFKNTTLLKDSTLYIISFIIKYYSQNTNKTVVSYMMEAKRNIDILLLLPSIKIRVLFVVNQHLKVLLQNVEYPY